MYNLPSIFQILMIRVRRVWKKLDGKLPRPIHVSSSGALHYVNCEVRFAACHKLMLVKTESQLIPKNRHNESDMNYMSIPYACGR